VTSMSETTIKPRSYTSLWILVAVFALPPLVAWLFFLNPQWLPTGRSNYGTLIDPPRSVESLMLHTAEGENLDWQALRDHWTLSVIAEGGCDAACIETLIKLRQIRLATGADSQRIERLLVLLPDADGRLDLPNLKGLEGTRLAISDSTQRERLLSLFPVHFDEQAIPLFVIDPRLNFMMTHDTSKIASKQILQDLQKLLKASQGWSNGGQYGHQ
jgi:cytochrome oxidase Cu insertion factor (SCO1/SenC/PrrC family)